MSIEIPIKPDPLSKLETTQSQSVPFVLQWDNICYSVQVKDKKTNGKNQQPIVKNASASIHPGEMIAILGSSGAGKTSLLNVLAGRIDSKNSLVTGSVLLNGKPRTQAWRRQAAYVEQNDVLYPNLTVRETLYFAAELRLRGASSMSRDKKNAIVRSVIEELGLQACAETKIGGQFFTGISGGERKRVCIGVELLNDPSMLFLDEPTSGLDSSTAYRVVTTCKSLAARNRCVLMTIHQPKADIFASFDKVILMARGCIMFFGTPLQALQFFDHVGYAVPAYTNPADWYIDVLSVDGVISQTKKEDGSARLDTLLTQYQTWSTPSSTLDSMVIHADESNDMKMSGVTVTSTPTHASTPTHKELSSPPTISSTTSTMESFNNSWFHEIWTLFKRNLKNFSREKQVTVIAVIQSVIMSLLIGGIYYNLGIDQRDVQNRLGVLFFIATNQSFGPIFGTITVFMVEKNIFRRERAAGAYRVLPYFLAKNLSEFPIQMGPPLIFGCISYYMIRLRADASHFFIFLGIITLMCFTSQSLGLAIGAAVDDVRVAGAIAPVTIIFFMLFSGFFANLASIPDWCSWIRHISYISYGFRAFAQNEFTDLTLAPCNSISGACYHSGNEVIQSFAIDTPSVTACCLILIGMSLFYRLLSVTLLYTKGQQKLNIKI